MRWPFRFQRKVYLDNNATTEPSPAVVKVMDKTLREAWGNPSSLYRIAQSAAMVLESARQELGHAINAQPEEIIFTGCASEANNQVLKMIADLQPQGRNVIVTSPLEHPSVLSALEYLQQRNTIVEVLPVDTMGRIDLDLRSAWFGKRTALLCVMLANNETGVLQNVAELARHAHAAGALVLCDCVQALGKIPVDVRALGVDYATFSAHKIHGPKGVGALYVRTGAPLAPFLHGGHQEHGHRAGTESTHNIAGFAQAVRANPVNLQRSAQMRALRQRLREGIAAVCPLAQFNSGDEGFLSNTLSVRFTGVANSVLMGYLDFRGIAVSAGSACNTQANEPSHVLTALGLTAEAARETIRFSLGGGGPRPTCAKDIQYVVDVLREYFGGGAPRIGMLTPSQLDESMLADPDLWIFDIRHGYDRLLLKSLPGAHEATYPYHRHYAQIPRHKHIVVVCQAGFDAPVIAYALRARGFTQVSFVMAGMLGWKLQCATLYGKLAGHNVHKLVVPGLTT